jgi:PmbA protein
LLDALVGVLGADQVRRKKSPFAERMGERIASAGFNLREGGGGLGGPGGLMLTPFDREGQPRTATTLVEDGVLRSFLYDSREARHVGLTASSHAQGGAASAPMVGPACIELDAGTDALEDLMNMKLGVMVTRFAGTVSASSGDFSGVVKGGFLVEDGHPRPIHETTVSGNLWVCLNNISGISRERTTFYGRQRWPAIRMEDVSITAG